MASIRLRPRRPHRHTVRVTAHVQHWRDNLAADGQVTISSSRTFGAIAGIAGIAGATGSLEIPDGALAIFGIVIMGGLATFGLRVALTGRPSVTITPSHLLAYGTRLPWRAVVDVDSVRYGRRGRRGVVLWCTDEAAAEVRRTASRWYRWTTEPDRRLLGFENRFGLPASLAGDADELAAWLTELAATAHEQEQRGEDLAG